MAQCSDLQDYVDELTKCPICLDDLVNPKSLPCVHTFCMQCIKGYCKGSEPGAHVSCPICRSSLVVPDGGVEELPNNFFLKGLADAKRASGRSADFVPCIGCSDPSEATASSVPITPATRHCIGCGQNICDSCSRPHGKIPGHDIVPLGRELQSEVLKSQGSFCTQHPINRLDIYCIECRKNVCVTCHALRHRLHDCRDINEVYVEFRDTIERDMQLVLEKEKNIQQKSTKLEIKQQQGIANILKRQTDLSQFAGEIRRQVDDAVNQLVDRLSNEKKDISKVASDDHLYEFELATYQSFTSYSSELIKNGKPYDITHAYVELHARAEELLQREVKTHDYQLPACTVSPEDLFDDLFNFISSKSPKHRMQEQQVMCKINSLEQERKTVDSQLVKLTEEYNAKTKRLEKEIEDLKHGKEETNSQLTMSKLLVEQYNAKTKRLEKEIEDLKRGKEDTNSQLTMSKLLVEQLSTKVKQLEKERDDIITEHARQVASINAVPYILPVKQTAGPPSFTSSYQASTSFASASESLSENELPILRHRFPAGDPVVALTCLGDELFVLRYESRQEIRIYDTEDFKSKGTLSVYCLSDDTRWCGMTSCAANSCIYVSDSFKDAVYRVHSDTEELSTWNVGSRPNGLSSTKSSNIVIAYYKASKLQEYTRNGSLVREICLQGDVHSPVHAILWNKGKFAVSHHGSVDGVSIVDTTGRVLVPRINNFMFNEQRNMAVKENGSLMVADSNNNIIRVVDPCKPSVSDMSLPISGGLNDPWSLCYDESRRRLYIGEYDGKRVLVFDNVE